MSTKEIELKVKELHGLKAMQDELTAEIESLQDEIKSFMGDKEVLRIADFKITWKTVKSTRLDSKKLKADMPDVAEQYTIPVEYKRFTIA